MTDDFRRIFYIIIVGFFLTIFLWIGFVFMTGCGWSLACTQAEATPEHTPIPSLIPATLPPVNRLLGAAAPTAGALAGTPSTGGATPTEEASGVPRPTNPGGPGPALGLTGNVASGQQIFAANCAVCHAAEGKGGNPNPGSTDGTIPPLNPIDPLLTDPNPKTFAYNIDLFIEHGSTPDGPGPSFSMPAWGDQKRLTPQQIADVIAYVISLNPVKATAGGGSTPIAGAASPTAPPATGPTTAAGLTPGALTGTPPTGGATSTEEASGVPRPTNPGGPGPALGLTGNVASGQQVFSANCAVCHAAEGKGGNPNPGSTDGTIPPLNPIDPLLKDPNPKTFAYNIDLFIEHGSTPDGPGPSFSMPAWGDQKRLTPQQIADVIAYVISLNP